MTQTASPDMTQWFVAIGLFLVAAVGVGVYNAMHPSVQPKPNSKPPANLL